MEKEEPVVKPLGKKIKLFVGTPMYGGMCCGPYAISCINLLNCLNQTGIEVLFCFLYDDALVPRARNNIVHQFLQSDCTHLLFIDGDIEFQPEHVLSVLHQDADVIGGPYAKKHIHWQKVAAIARDFPEIPPQDLHRLASDYVFHSNKVMTNPQELFEVEEAGTGFLLVRREVFFKMMEAYPQLRYKPDDQDGFRYCFFPTPIDSIGSLTGGGTDRYLSEDYAFCSLWKKIGGKVMLAPWVALNHIGNYSYICDFNLVMKPILKNETPQEKPAPQQDDWNTGKSLPEGFGVGDGTGGGGLGRGPV